MTTHPALPLPLPMAVAREWLRQFREYRVEMSNARGNESYIRWRTNAHCCQLRVKELRAANPRARKPRNLEGV